MDTLDAYVLSHESMIEESEALREWELALALGSPTEKLCKSISVYNGTPVVPMKLQSKENKSMLGKMSDKLRERVFSLHRIIMIVYAPSVLQGTQGTLNIKLFNQDSGESITVVGDHSVSQAATFVCRWPRAVQAQGAGLALLVAVDGVSIKKGGLVGVLTPYWEDKMSAKMVYEKQLPALVYPLEEQEPSHYVKDVRKLRALVAERVHLGSSGSDVAPQIISMERPASKPKVEALPPPEPTEFIAKPKRKGRSPPSPSASVATKEG